jgi:hypothetical protein
MAGEDIKTRVDWLDGERRKDKALWNQWKDKLDALDSTAASQTKQLQELATQLAHLSARMTPAKIEDVLAQAREDTNHMLETMEKRRLALDERTAKARTVERDRVDKTFLDIQTKLDALSESRNVADARKEEQTRQAALLQDMRKTLDTIKQRDEERGRIIAAAEEGRRQDIRRMAEIQGEQQAVRAKAGEADAHLEALESGVRRLDSKVADLMSSELDRRNAQALWQEQQTAANLERDRQWKDWEKRVNASVTRMEDFLGKLETYSEALRAMQQATSEFQELNERMELRLREMAEMQRIQEDRLRQDWAAFLADDQKRYTVQTLAREDEWREHDRQSAKSMDRLARMEQKVDDFTGVVRASQENNRAQLEALANMIREWLARIPQQF